MGVDRAVPDAREQRRYGHPAEGRPAWSCRLPWSYGSFAKGDRKARALGVSRRYTTFVA
ncbi:hypothetical protein GCM10022233_16640 [Streptomyces shaanxiensis]|uniref:DUF397 domain-containing protein n=1 Tax=Streptomyces shaanxiensis TaxID=653357 RepID=A0ABP7UMH7_9ACTN